MKQDTGNKEKDKSEQNFSRSSKRAKGFRRVFGRKDIENTVSETE